MEMEPSQYPTWVLVAPNALVLPLGYMKRALPWFHTVNEGYDGAYALEYVGLEQWNTGRVSPGPAE